MRLWTRSSVHVMICSPWSTESWIHPGRLYLKQIFSRQNKHLKAPLGKRWPFWPHFQTDSCISFLQDPDHQLAWSQFKSHWIEIVVGTIIPLRLIHLHRYIKMHCILIDVSRIFNVSIDNGLDCNRFRIACFFPLKHICIAGSHGCLGLVSISDKTIMSRSRKVS